MPQEHAHWNLVSQAMNQGFFPPAFHFKIILNLKEQSKVPQRYQKVPHVLSTQCAQQNTTLNYGPIANPGSGRWHVRGHVQGPLLYVHLLCSTVPMPCVGLQNHQLQGLAPPKASPHAVPLQPFHRPPSLTPGNYQSGLHLYNLALFQEL